MMTVATVSHRAPDDPGEVINEGEVLPVNGAAAHPLYRQHQLVRSGSVGSYAGVPLDIDKFTTLNDTLGRYTLKRNSTTSPSCIT